MQNADRIRRELPKLIQPDQSDYDMVTLLESIENTSAMCEVASEIMRLAAMKICDDVAAVSEWDSDAFKAGIEAACEEVQTRISEFNPAALLKLAAPPAKGER